MLGIMINVITAPGETFETIVKDFNWKQALITHLAFAHNTLAVVSGYCSKRELIAKSSNGNKYKKVLNGECPNSRGEKGRNPHFLVKRMIRLYDQFDEPGGMGNIHNICSMRQFRWPIRKLLFWYVYLPCLVGNLIFRRRGNFYGRSVYAHGILCLYAFC